MDNMDNEYAPIEGIQSVIDKSQELAFGDSSPALKEGRMVGMQTLSGTGALRLGLDFLKDFYPKRDSAVYVPIPTWPCHPNLLDMFKFQEKGYRYYDPARKDLNFEWMTEDLEKAPKGSIVIYHPCAHNPTGCDPTEAQWDELVEQMIRKEFYVKFDFAY